MLEQLELTATIKLKRKIVISIKKEEEKFVLYLELCDVINI